MAYGTRRALARVVAVAVAVGLSVGAVGLPAVRAGLAPVVGSSAEQVAAEQVAAAAPSHGHRTRLLGHRPTANEPRSSGAVPVTTAGQPMLPRIGVRSAAVPVPTTTASGLPSVRAPPGPIS
jgi:hypothetical protein